MAPRAPLGHPCESMLLSPPDCAHVGCRTGQGDAHRVTEHHVRQHALLRRAQVRLLLARSRTLEDSRWSSLFKRSMRATPGCSARRPTTQRRWLAEPSSTRSSSHLALQSLPLHSTGCTLESPPPPPTFPAAAVSSTHAPPTHPDAAVSSRPRCHSTAGPRTPALGPSSGWRYTNRQTDPPQHSAFSFQTSTISF